MGNTVKNLKIIVDADTSQAQKSIGGLGNVLQTALGTTIGFLSAQALPQLISGIGSFVTEAIDAQKNVAQLDAVLKSTSGAAGMSKDAILSLTDALSQNSTFEGDAVLQGENLFLTFTNIGKNVFPDATQAMVDMAAAMGTDVKSGAIQLGKALNDPIKGVSALSEVGVAFTETQKETIKTMVESGDVAGAQRVILAELNNEFGGSAAAQAGTFGGQIQMLQNSLKDMAETVGTAALPLLQSLVKNVVKPAIPIVKGLVTAVSDFVTVALDPFIMGIEDGWSPLDTLTTGIGNLFLLIGNGNPTLQALGDWFIADAPNAFNTFMTNLQPTIQSIVQWFQTNVPAALQSLSDAWNAIWPTIQTTAVSVITYVQSVIAAAMPSIQTNVGGALAQMQTFWANHGAEITTIVQGLITVIGIGFKVMADGIGATLVLLSGVFTAFWALVNGDTVTAQTVMRGAITQSMNMILSLVGTNLTQFTAVWQSNWDMAGLILQTVWTNMQTDVSNATAGIQAGIIQFVSDVINTFNSLVASIKLAFSVDWLAVGRSIMDGIGKGIRDRMSSVAGEAIDAARSIIDNIKKELGINSPSAVMAAIGVNISAGLAQGIQSGASMPVMAMQKVSRATAGNGAQAVTPISNNNNSRVTNIYLTANYAHEKPARLSEEIRRLQMLGRNV